jgi:flagellar biosynthesis GTPase FlhF
MTVKTYQAPTMSEALSRVKLELGRDAVIVRTRSVRKGWLWGWLAGQRLWEVTASGSVELPDRSGDGKYCSTPAGDRMAAELGAGKEVRRVSAVCDHSVGEEVGRIRQIVEALLTMQTAPKSDAAPTEVRALRLQLLRQEVGDSPAN